jgi:hypothetical protein
MVSASPPRTLPPSLSHSLTPSGGCSTPNYHSRLPHGSRGNRVHGLARWTEEGSSRASLVGGGRASAVGGALEAVSESEARPLEAVTSEGTSESEEDVLGLRYGWERETE